ncbi:MAG: DUF3285 domain-containing protein [Oscillatoria sp. SIO1A7]|nr:DUF3285 domain-containing protein [Oscillatoria sp. SIO1A7]
MSQPSTPDLDPVSSAENTSPTSADKTSPTISTEPSPSYVKLAMRNMVKKGGQSVKHFLLTSFGLLALLVGLSYLTR